MVLKISSLPRYLLTYIHSTPSLCSSAIYSTATSGDNFSFMSMARALNGEDQGKKVVEYLSLLHVGCSQVSHFSHQNRGGCSFSLFLCCLMYPKKPFLLFFHSLNQVQLQLCLGFPGFFPPS